MFNLNIKCSTWTLNVQPKTLKCLTWIFKVRPEYYNVRSVLPSGECLTLMGTFYIPERDPAPLCKIMFLRTGLCSATTGLVLFFLYMIIPVYTNPEIHYSIVFLCSVRYSFREYLHGSECRMTRTLISYLNIIFGLSYKMFNQNISCSTRTLFYSSATLNCSS